MKLFFRDHPTVTYEGDMYNPIRGMIHKGDRPTSIELTSKEFISLVNTLLNRGYARDATKPRLFTSILPSIQM